MADYQPRVRWCLAVGAPVLAARNLDVRELGGWDRSGMARARGEDELAAATQSYLAELGVTNRAELMAWARDRLHGTEEKAHAMARLVAAAGWATWAGWLSDDDAVQIILVAGKLAQDAYASWDELGAAYARVAGELAPAARELWATLPWQQALDVTLFQPGAQHRVLRTTCPTCSAPRRRPSTSAYVYCDHCGSLVDYDLAVAMENPAAPPGPVFEALVARHRSDLDHAIDRGDRGSYQALRHLLVDEWVGTCPHAVPVRCKDPGYRQRYVCWLAEADVVAAFDAQAQVTQAAMTEATTKLVFAAIEGRTRVAAEPFRAMTEAMFAYEARRDELFRAEVYAMQPDGASRELQRRIGFSAFVQGWLPLLDEADASALVERTGLRRDYVPFDGVATRTQPCAHCGAPLELLDGARRVVCDHCGRVVDIIGS